MGGLAAGGGPPVGDAPGGAVRGAVPEGVVRCAAR